MPIQKRAPIKNRLFRAAQEAGHPADVAKKLAALGGGPRAGMIALRSDYPNVIKAMMDRAERTRASRRERKTRNDLRGKINHIQTKIDALQKKITASEIELATRKTPDPKKTIANSIIQLSNQLNQLVTQQSKARAELLNARRRKAPVARPRGTTGMEL